MASAFSEDRTFRIDHYLGKETVQNLLALRFANILFEPLWNATYIEHVQITVAETVGLEGRVAFYDDAGALREVEVPSARLDSVIPDRNVNVGAWIDVEGAIREVLAGASGLLPQVAVLKVEVEDAQIWEGQLISLGVIEHLLAAGLVPVARDAEYVGQYNVLFVSGRWARHAAVRQALEVHAYRLEHEWSREPSRVRQSESLRGVLRPVRRGVSQIVGRARRG